MDEKRSKVAPVAAAVLLLVVPLATYVAGYFLRGDFITGYGAFRVYGSRLEATVFSPAAKIEWQLRGTMVRAAYIHKNGVTGGSTLEALP
jgi:hypothetical protein